MKLLLRPLALAALGGRARGIAVVVAAMLAAPAAALSQSLVVTPSVSLTETATDNRELVGVGKQSDLITQISPGLTVTAKGGALQGFLSYSLNGLVYAQESAKNSAYHQLSSTGKLSLLEGRGGIEASASAGRQVISAYGTQSAGATSASANQAQVFSYSLAPYLAGKTLGDLSYRARLSLSQSISDAPTGNGDAKSLNGSVGLSSRIGPLGWGLDISRTVSESQERPRTHNGRLTGSLNYSPDIEVQLAFRAGTEADDLRSGRSERTTTWGAGLAWTPGPRTTLNADMDRRFFGRSHAFSLTHRMARTTFNLSDSRSLDTSGQSSRGALSNYDFFAQQLASITDAALRDAVVRQVLAARNLDPGGREIAAGFLTAGPTIQRTQNGSMTYQGLRSTITLLAFQTWSTSASNSVSTRGDLANGNTVNQRGLSLSLSHRLTSDASLTITASQQKTASAGTVAGNDLRTVIATWSDRLGPYTNVSLGVRHSVADSDLNPYQESAVIGSIRLQF